MQDISNIPTFDIQHYINLIKEKPIDQKTMKNKVDKIYSITSYTENQYLADVLELYAWMLIVNRHINFKEIFTTQKLQKYFCQQFLGNSVKYLILCKKFQMIEMMTLTQQILVESLIFFNNHFDQLEKYPKLTQLPKYVLEIGRQFYKLNHISQHPHLIIQPTKEQIQQNYKFVENLKVGDKVDALKIQHYGKRFLWSRAKIRKIGYLSVTVQYLFQKHSFDRNIEKKSFEIVPLYTYTKDNFDWRLQLKAGDWVDYQATSGCWTRSCILQVREVQQDDRIYKQVRFQKTDENQEYYSVDWISATSVKIQKEFSIIKNEEGKNTLNHQIYIDDYNDLILDFDNLGKNAIIRSEYTKSILFVQLVNFADSLKIFDKILAAVSECKMNIEIVSQLIGLVNSVQVTFKRRFAIQYLSKLASSLTNYIKNSDETNIRNFSKERLQIIMFSLNEFYKRIVSVTQRKSIIQFLQLELALRFINSDFLQRKMHAVTTITQFVRMCKSNYNKISYNQLSTWIIKNDIIKKIFNEKSHPQLISRSSDFLKIFLYQQPDPSILEPFLEINDSILKIVNQLFDYFPKSFKVLLIQKITSKKNIKNKDALQIVKKFGGNQLWLLQNGGDGWVDVIKQKKKRQNDILEVFKQDFEIVYKITKQVDGSAQNSKFKNEFFEALENNKYLNKVMQNMNTLFDQRIQFMYISLSNFLSIPQDLFQKLMDLWQKYQQQSQLKINSNFYQIYALLLNRLNKEQIRLFFDKFFIKEQKLKNLNERSFEIFKNTFIIINESYMYIQKKIGYVYTETYPLKRQRRQITVISVNPNKLIGMPQIMNIIFLNQKLAVIQLTLEFIQFLFEHLTKSLSGSIKQFKQNFLQQCLNKLYQTTSYQKYLKIIQNILNESEKQGNGNLRSLSALLPPQKLKILIIDTFNATKRKLLFQVDSNLTLYELRFAIGKQISAYIHQMTITVDGKNLDERLNGYTIHQAKLKGPLLIQKKVKIQKANLTSEGGKMTPDARRIFERIFTLNSTDGLMSKAQCKKYHQKCVGDMTTIGQTKVEKIYESYDLDKDGYLTVEDFIKFYQNSIKLRQQTVWSNLQTLGFRPDLKLLDNLTITHVEPQKLIRYFLLKNQKFMNLLFKILNSDIQPHRKASWDLLQRLPLCQNTQFEFKLGNNYSLRYWLLMVDYKQQYENINVEILEKILDSDDQTLSIGLKVASSLESLDLKIFQKLIQKLIIINNKKQFQYYEKIILNYSLNLIVNCLKNEKIIQEDYIQNHLGYQNIFLTGLMSINNEIRQIYCTASSQILDFSIQHNFDIFYNFFSLIYKNFQKCNKSSLYTQYFQLFSHLLEILKNHPYILQKLDLNWIILSKSMIQLFKSHKCTQQRLSSPADWVAQGFMKILNKLLDSKTISYFTELVSYIFQNLLFPEGGLNKLKNSHTRNYAYELIYEICSFQNNQNGINGIELLFNSGFRKIYKNMSSTKIQTTYSYFNSYNQIRSELGYAGIRNLGCICYMIAMIQQFYMTRPFRYLILMADDKQPQSLIKRGLKQFDDNVLHQFQNMFANLELTQRQQFNPDEFCYSFKDFEGNPVNVSIQQDAQQFLNMIFDKLEKSIKNTPFKHLLENIYGGKSCTQLICTSCNAVKERFENFYNLSLEVKGFQNIDESFKKFISGEVISDYKCDSCNKKTDTIKKCLISTLPNYFIIHLQRICFNYDKFENQKVNSRWQFPHNLNIHDYTIQKQKNIKNSDDFQYQLRGIVVHIGSAEYGHYFSYIKTENDNWLQFNDQRIREFDPKDIQTQCFGGQYWRRQNQSAYLLVYQKKYKSNLKLQFQNIQQEEKLIKQLRLQHFEKIQKVEKKQIVKQQQQLQIKNEQKVQQVKVQVTLACQKVPSYVPQKLIAKINKSNQEFSMNINISNNQFAHFVYRILSINPPVNLRTQYLQLCYQCFNLKQQHIQNNQLSLSQWMAKRFRQLIVGSGWEFFNNNINNWQKQIINHEKSSRISIKNLMVSVISDIIQTNNFSSLNIEQQLNCADNSEQLKKVRKVCDFLDKTLEMLNTEILKNWMRFQEYFEFWIELIRQNEWMRHYAYQKKFILVLFDFILQNNSPIRTKQNRLTMGSKFTSPQYQYPIQIISILSNQSYVYSKLEKKCLNHYMFLQKLTKHHPKNCKIIEIVCKNNSLNSQRFAYMLLYSTSKVTHSDDIKPIIQSIHQYLQIQDQLSQKRLQWILGIPQIIYHPRTNSFGLYGLHSVAQPIYQFKSAVRFQPILQQVNLIREKYEHVAALLVSMLMQLQKDRNIQLNEYPSYSILNQDYTSWFGGFVESYYQDTRKAYAGSNYVGYGDRIKDLWNSRVVAKKNYKNWLIGKTIKCNVIGTKTTQNYQIIESQYTCAIIQSKSTLQQNDSIPSDLIYLRTGAITSELKKLKKYKNFEYFISKGTNNIAAGGINYQKQDSDSQDENAPLIKSSNPFETFQEANVIKKITLKNLNRHRMLFVVKFQKNSTNFKISTGQITFLLDCQKQQSFYITKIYPNQEWGQLSYSVLTYQYQDEKLNYQEWPKQIITPSNDSSSEAQSNSDEQIEV